MIDHGASDKYELLVHLSGAAVKAASSADTVVYDTQTSGILNSQPSGYSAGLHPKTDLAQGSTVELPDLSPSTLACGTLVPEGATSCCASPTRSCIRAASRTRRRRHRTATQTCIVHSWAKLERSVVTTLAGGYGDEPACAPGVLSR